jgi:hypothetical protein
MPITFHFDPYWPIFRVIDQKGYQILRISYPDIDCITDYGLIDTDIDVC